MSVIPDQQAMRARLEAELKSLLEEDARGLQDQATVVLDQQSVGRLSRMDAMQRQAMAQATARRRDLRKRQIEAALLRAGEDELGYCTDCGEAIAPERLEIDPAVPRCLSCTRG
jgi:DnaK suppressor protein